MSTQELSQDFRRRLDEQFDAVRRMPPPLPPDERHRHVVSDVAEGGYLRFEGHTYLAREVSRYAGLDGSTGRESWEWFELKLFRLEDSETIYMEWEEDDELEIYLATDKLAFRDLEDDEGEPIDETDLDRIVAGSRVIVCDGTAFDYRNDYPARFYRGGKKGRPQDAYFYDFATPGGERLTVEEWTTGGRESYEIYLSRELSPRAVEVLSTGGK